MTAATINTAATNAVAKIADKLSGGKPVTRWGMIWRIAVIMLVFVAAITALIAGAQFGIGYVAGLGLSEAVAGAISVAISVTTSLLNGCAAWFTFSKINSVLERREATKLVEGAKKASPNVVDLDTAAGATA